MKNFAIIEDLDFNQYEDLLHKNQQDLLADCFIRNFSLIKKYAQSDDEVFISKFKKKLIPKYVQQLDQYCQSQLLKNRQLFYARRKNSNHRGLFCRKNRQSFPELNKNSSLSQQNLAPYDQVLEPNSFLKSFPIVSDQKSVPEKLLPDQNLIQTQTLKASHSQNLIFGPIFLISSKNKHNELQKISKTDLSESYANVYSNSINFCQKILLKNTFDKIGSKQQSRQFTDGLKQFYQVKKTLANQKSIEKKMINVLKKRKSSKNLKIKIFSGYINTKKSLTEVKDKQNNPKISFDELNKQIKQPLLKNKMLKLGLEEKLSIPIKNHRATTSCMLEKPHLPGQSIQILDQIIDLSSINSRKNVLKNIQNKFIFPKFG